MELIKKESYQKLFEAWFPVDPYNVSPEAWRVVWDDWKRLNPNPWRNKRTRAKANKMLRAVRKGWKPPTVMIDLLRLIEEARRPVKDLPCQPKPGWASRLIIPAIPKPEDF